LSIRFDSVMIYRKVKDFMNLLERVEKLKPTNNMESQLIMILKDVVTRHVKLNERNNSEQ